MLVKINGGCLDGSVGWMWKCGRLPAWQGVCFFLFPSLLSVLSLSQIKKILKKKSNGNKDIRICHLGPPGNKHRDREEQKFCWEQEL